MKHADRHPNARNHHLNARSRHQEARSKSRIYGYCRIFVTLLHAEGEHGMQSPRDMQSMVLMVLAVACPRRRTSEFHSKFRIVIPRKSLVAVAKMIAGKRVH